MSRQTSQEAKSQRIRLSDDELLARVHAKLSLNSNGCSIWHGGIGRGGYGLVWNGVRNMAVHRAVYEATHKVRLTRWQFVCHACDVPACANINHLWLGTPKENTADMDKKGRRIITEKNRAVLANKPAKGSANNMAKLSDAQVNEILTSPIAAKEIAQKFGVTRNHVYKIRNGWRWSHAR
jgi:hypothetical protein